MELDIELDLSPLLELGEQMEMATQKLLAEMAQAQIVNTNLRVQKGLGVRDQAMPKYTDSYKKRRENAGRRGNKRDLDFTGKMLRSMNASAPKRTGEGWEVELGFSSRAEAEKAWHNQERDDWFGVSPKDEQKLKDLANRRIKKLIEEQS